VATINQGMKLAIAQMNFVVGDIAGNSAKILSAAEQAQQNGATLLLTPELSLTGYPPEDLLLREDFNAASQAVLLQLAQKIDGITVIVGHPHAYQGNCYNAASVLQDGKVLATYHKHALPNHSVFDELRYFSAGTEPLVFEHHGVKCGVLICADVWDSPPAILAKKQAPKCC